MHDPRKIKKIRVAALSVASNSVLIVIKVIAGVMSGSVSIISEAIHSAMDLFASLIAFFSVKISSNPPDDRHPYGHGKIENISGVAEALLIFVAAIWIIYEAVHKLLEPEPIEAHLIAISVMGVSAVINIIVSRKLYKVAKETDSVALEADALHLKTDVYTSAGVGIGIALIWITGYYWLDAIIAIAVAIMILFEAFRLLKKAFSPLMDAALPEEDIAIIREIISKNLREGMRFHRLRTRKSGNYKYIDLHLEVSPETTVKASHDLCDIIEQDICEKIADAEVNIHIEPLQSETL